MLKASFTSKGHGKEGSKYLSHFPILCHKILLPHSAVVLNFLSYPFRSPFCCPSHHLSDSGWALAFLILSLNDQRFCMPPGSPVAASNSSTLFREMARSQRDSHSVLAPFSTLSQAVFSFKCFNLFPRGFLGAQCEAAQTFFYALKNLTSNQRNE